MKLNSIYKGDCLDILKKFPDNKIDLIYIDPPFNTGKTQKLGTNKYKDSFKNMDNYLKFLMDRIKECYRVLKETGVFCLHLDYRSVHYAKVECDRLFGYDNFINEIIWCYAGGASSKRCFAKKHDNILVYYKKDYNFNNIKEKSYNRGCKPYNLKGIKEYKDNYGYYTKVNQRDYVNEPSLAPASKEREYTFNVQKQIKSKKSLDRLKNPKGAYSNIYTDKNAHLRNSPDYIYNPNMFHTSTQYMNYPSQKPIKLLQRFIKAFTNKDDIVLDAFMGSGTTLDAAYGLGRKFIGIDQNPDSIKVVKARMLKQHDLLLRCN